ncbi:MAG: phosphatidate cytidylyltransferase [Clostridia bacterium]|nr:phosphatidate cytidylyltransferase [Clostridia bacterium]
MVKRIITAIVAIAIFVPICYFSDYVVFPIAIGILCAISVFEISKCLGFTEPKRLVLTIPMYIIALGLPILRYYLTTNSEFMLYAMGLAFFMLMYSLAYVMLRKNADNVSDILMLYAMFMYVVGCFTSIVIVRYTGFEGKYMYLLIFLGAWICDTFAYFTGRLLGKHKLIPEISPKKTVEGAIGGIVFTIIGFIVYALILKHQFNYEMPIYQICILGVVLPIVSQIGDLVASSIKRQYKVKDFGNVFPGHGGIIDRFDSVMLVSPTLCMINAIISLF